MCLSVCLSAYVYSHLFVYLSVFLSGWMLVCLSVQQFHLCTCQSVNILKHIGLEEGSQRASAPWCPSWSLQQAPIPNYIQNIQTSKHKGVWVLQHLHAKGHQDHLQRYTFMSVGCRTTAKYPDFLGSERNAFPFPQVHRQVACIWNVLLWTFKCKMPQKVCMWEREWKKH